LPTSLVDWARFNLLEADYSEAGLDFAFLPWLPKPDRRVYTCGFAGLQDGDRRLTLLGKVTLARRPK